jgi:hypothetical protein
MLKWAVNNGYNMDKSVCMYSAINGNLELLKFAMENGCSWYENACRYAAIHGHLLILEWAKLNGYPLELNDETYIHALRNCQFKVVDWLVINGCQVTKKLNM